MKKEGNRMKYCKYCAQQVEPTKKINWLLLLVMCAITGGSWLFIYVLYYFLFKSKVCPICGGKL